MCALCEGGGRGFHAAEADSTPASQARADWANPGKPMPGGSGTTLPAADGVRFDQNDFSEWFNGVRPQREGGDGGSHWSGLGLAGASLVDALLNDQLGQTVSVKAPALDLATNFVASDGSETEADSGPGSGQDGIAGNNTTAEVLTIGAPAVTNHINTNGDEDWYQVTLEAGHYYVFTMDPQGTLDAVLELIGTNGSTVLASSDGPLAEDTEVVSFYCETSGTYFINADGFQTDTGTYTLQGVEAPLPTPLDAINWGGDENVVPGAADTVILVYFAPAGTPPPGTPGGGSALAWSQYEIDQAMLAFQQYSNICNVTFQITTDINQADFKMVLKANGGSTLGQMGPPNTGAGAGIGVFYRSGFGWDEAGNGGLEQGGFGFVTLTHEIGHGMGMAHPHDNGGGSGVMLGVSSSSDSGLFTLNQSLFTVMSYLDAWDTGPNGGTPTPGGVGAFGFMGTLAAFDIAMMQIKYGANTTFNNTDTIYDINTSDGVGTFYQTIWDTGGVDTIRYTGANDANINLNAATLDYSATGGGSPSYALGVHMAYTIANGVVIENATGGFGNDTLTGNTANNVLTGNDGNDALSGGDGNDTLIGGVGTDTMTGGAGDDTFFVDAAGDVVNEANGGGFDVVYATVNYTLAAAVAVEVLSAYTQDSTSALNLTGNELANTIYGNFGVNTLMGVAGNDILLGLDGNDILDGGANDDVLIGGVGNDQMIGGSGNDIFFVADAGDTITEAAAGGNDLIYASANFTLNAGAEVEVISTANQGATTGLSLTGNELANIIYGDAGANTLGGGGGDDILLGLNGDDILNGGDGSDILIGGAGNDQMNGGLGDDGYFVDDAGDQVNELAGQGFDLIYASVSFTQAAGSAVEVLSTRDQAATTAINLTGNELNNTIYGNAGVNVLSGGAGLDILLGLAGADTLEGGAGNDFLFGGTGADIFRYSTTATADDFIQDFENGTDHIHFTAATGVDDFSDLVVTANGSGWAQITLPDGSTITLTGITTGQVDASDFTFGP